MPAGPQYSRATREATGIASFHLVVCADYVYFETNQSQPYQIRRIEELKKVRLRLFTFPPLCS